MLAAYKDSINGRLALEGPFWLRQDLKEYVLGMPKRSCLYQSIFIFPGQRGSRELT